MPTPKPATPVTRTPDNFQLARSIYNRRTALFEKASALLAAAPLAVQALVESHEEADAQKTIEGVDAADQAAE